MHNNGIGPEVCGKPSTRDLDFYSSPYVDAGDKPLANAPACVPFDPSVEGRYRLFKASMEELLNPGRRLRKVNLTDEDIIVDVAPKVQIGGIEASFSVVLPKGAPAIMLNSLRYKDLLQDIVLMQTDRAKLVAKYAGILPAERLRELQEGLERLRVAISANRGQFTLDITKTQSDFIQNYYSNVLGRDESAGHRFGEGLTDREKQALIAFLATL
jgi:hypothetical protein